MFEGMTETEKKALSNAIEHRIRLLRVGKSRAALDESVTMYEMPERVEEAILMDVSTHLQIKNK